VPNYLHRTTKQYSVSISTIDLSEPEANYIQDPDVSTVIAFPTKYWLITGDLVSLMDAAAQAVVDAAEVQAALDADRGEAATRANLDISTRALVDVLLFEINKVNTRVQELQDSLSEMKQTTGGTANLRLAIPAPSSTTNPGPAAFLNVNPKLRSEVLQKYVDDINAGVADP